MKKIGFSYRRQMEEKLADKLNEQLETDMSEAELFSFAEFDPKAAERGGYSN